MKSIPTQKETQKLIEAAAKKIHFDARLLGSSQGVSGLQRLTNLRECISPIMTACNNLIISAYQSLLSFSSIDPEKTKNRNLEIEEEIEALKKRNELNKIELENYPGSFSGLFKFILYAVITAFIFSSDVMIMTSVLQLYMANLISALILGAGIGMALYILPVISAYQASKAPEHKRKWIERGSFLLAFTIFLLLIYARQEFNTEMGNDQGWFAPILFVAVNTLFFVILHRLAKILMVPAIKEYGETYKGFKVARKIKKVDKEIRKLNALVAYNNRDIEFYEQACEQALLNEEKIQRIYLEAVSIYRESYRAHSTDNMPSFLSNDPPSLDFLVRTRSVTITPTSTQYGRNRVGFTYGIIFLLLTYSCNTSPNHTEFLGVLCDVSEPIPSVSNLTAKSVLGYTSLASNDLMGMEVSVARISDRKFTTIHHLSLQAQAELLSNSVHRKRDLQNFIVSIDSIFCKTRNVEESKSENTLIFHMLSVMLAEMEACTTCTEGVIIIASDLLENNPAVFSAYSTKNMQALAQDRHPFIKQMREAYPAPTITKPLRLIIRYCPTKQEQDRFEHLVILLTEYIRNTKGIVTIIAPDP